MLFLKNIWVNHFVAFSEEAPSIHATKPETINKNVNIFTKLLNNRYISIKGKRQQLKENSGYICPRKRENMHSAPSSYKSAQSKKKNG